MSSELLRHVLRQLERFPEAEFRESELAEAPEAMAELASQKILRFVQSDPEQTTYPCPEPGPECTDRVVSCINGRLLAVCTCPAEKEPIELSRPDLRRWRVDLGEIAQRFQEANGLTGEPEPLEDRLLFIGEKRQDDLSLAFALGLFRDDRQALRYLRELPLLLSPRPYDRIVVVCPSFAPSARTGRELNALRVLAVPLSQEDPFALDYAAALAEPARPVPRVVLSDSEEEEAQRRGFRSRVPVHLTGRTSGRSQNIVEVGGREVEIADVPFWRFLRLVVGLVEEKDGFLTLNAPSGPSLAAEGLFATEGVDPAISRLRDAFKGYLGDLRHTHFIEVRRRQIRLSTHLKYVSWDRKALLNHHHAPIQALASRLPPPPGKWSRRRKMTKNLSNAGARQSELTS